MVKLDAILITAIGLTLTGIVMAITMPLPQTNSMPKEGFRLHGHFILNAYHADGVLFAHVEQDNIVVTAGFKGIGHLVFNSNSGVSPNTYRYIAIGSSGTAPTSADTALNSECGYTRQLTSSPTYSGGVNTLTGTFTGQTCNAQEIGILDASSSGNLLTHQTFSNINLASSDTLTATYTVTES